VSAVIAWTDLLADATATLSIPDVYAGTIFFETVAGTLVNIRDRTKAQPANLTLLKGTAPPGGEIRFTGFTAQPMLARVLAMLSANSVVQGLTVTVRLYSDAAWTTLVHTSNPFDQGSTPIWGSTAGDAYLLLSQDHSVQSIAVRFVAPAPGSYLLEIGRLWAGPAMVLDGVGKNWKAPTLDNSLVRVTPHRVVTHTRLARYRKLTAPLPRLTEAQVFGINDTNSVCLDRMKFEAGKGSTVIVLPRTSSTLYMRRMGVYGVLENDVEIEHVTGPYYRSSLVVAETL